jgi:pyruvate/2-oxoglutarate/acetoin dehydrogenase E1 component
VCGLDAPIPFSVSLEKLILPGKDDVKQAVKALLA